MIRPWEETQFPAIAAKGQCRERLHSVESALHMKTRQAVLVLGIVALAAVPTAAQALWLEPDPIAPGAGQPVAMHLMLGDRFEGEERAMDPNKVIAFQRLRKNGRENLERKAGTLPVAGYTTGDDGVEIVSLTWKGQTGGYYCKSIQVVGDAEPGHPLRFSELGQRLEIVLQTDPVTLARKGGRLEVQVLYEREPLAGVRLLALPKKNPVENNISAVTDEIGLASFDLTQPGPWLIQVNYKTSGARSRSTLVLVAGQP